MRFITVYSQGKFYLNDEMDIIVDQATGVNYLRTRTRNAMGITPLLGTNGQPIITKMGPPQGKQQRPPQAPPQKM